MSSANLHALPPEIYNTIFSCAHNSALCQFAKTSRLSFHSVIPHLWRDIGLKNLLSLLPKVYSNEVVTTSTAKDKTPILLPNHSFGRLDVYAPHVKRLSFDFSSDDIEYISRHLSVYSFLQSQILAVAVLPNLRSLHLRSSFALVPCPDLPLWIDILVPPTLSNFRCVIAAYPPTECIWSSIQLVLSQCLHLQQFEILLALDRGRVQEHRVLPLPQHPQIHLETLSLGFQIDDNKFFSWMAKAPHLKHLNIALSDLSGIQVPAESFQELRSLTVNSRRMSAVIDLWRTSITSNLTRANIIMDESNKVIEATEVSDIFRALVTNSPLLSHLNFFRLSVVSCSTLTRLRPLPLRILEIPHAEFAPTEPSPFQTIASFWPKLEELNLHSTIISLDDLVCISRHLPQLRELVVTIPPGFSLEAIRAPRLSPTELEAQRAVWLDHSFLLIPGSRFGNAHGYFENIAPVLAMTWPNMNISPYLCGGRHLKKRIDYYSSEVLQNGYVDRVVEVPIN